jgi:hypothetical protein
MTGQTQANRQAPVFGRGELPINAKPETVWAVMSNIGEWPSWNPDVKEASIDGELTEGNHFRWKAGPGTITSTLQAVDPPRTLAWSGKTMGISAIHVWKIEQRDGQTVAVTEESWEGLLASMFRGRSRKTLQHAIDSGLEALKAEAERRATA